MSKSRISGLCMLSIHREKLKHNEDFIAQVIEKFGQDSTRLVFLFDEKEKNQKHAKKKTKKQKTKQKLPKKQKNSFLELHLPCRGEKTYN